MARYKYQYDEHGRALLPWPCEYSLKDFPNKEAFEEYLDPQADEWWQIQRTLREGEPHPMAYGDREYDPRYQAALHAFEHEAAMERVHERHKPPPRRPPMTKEQRALWEGSGEDKAEAAKRLNLQRIIKEQLDRAAEHRARGNDRAARDSEERAAMFGALAHKFGDIFLRCQLVLVFLSREFGENCFEILASELPLERHRGRFVE